MIRLKAVLAMIAAVAMVLIVAPSASADTVVAKGNATGNKYRGGKPASGDVSYAVGLQLNRDSTGAITQVRSVARISKVRKVQSVQVDSVHLGTSTAAVSEARKAVNSKTAGSALNTTAWVPISPNKCVSYRTRGYFSVRWADGGVSKFSALSPLTKVCGPTRPIVKFSSCAALNKVYPHGVGRAGALDRPISKRSVTNYVVYPAEYTVNAAARDADHDGIACEKR